MRRVLLGIKIVEIKQPEQRNPLYPFRPIGKITGRHGVLIARIEDIQDKIFAVKLECPDVVYVLHHQVPHGNFGVEGGTFEQLYHQGSGRGNALVGKLTDLEYAVLANHGILVCYSKDLIRVEGAVKRNKSEFRIKSIFAWIKFTGIFNFFEIQSRHVAKWRSGQVLRYPVDVADIGGVEAAEQVVRFIVGVGSAGARGNGLVVGDFFSEVHQGDKVTVVGHRRPDVGNPDFDLGNVDVGIDNWQFAQRVVIIVNEVLGEEEVFVFFVVEGPYAELAGLGAALHGDGRGFAFLLGEYPGYRGPAELHLGFQSEKALASGNQGAVERKGNIPRFNQFDDLVFLAFVLEFQFVFKIKGSFCIVIGIEFNFIADLGHHAHLDALLEVEVGGAALADVERGIVAAVGEDAKGNFGASLRTDVNGVSSENPVEHLTANMYLGDYPCT